MQFIGGVGRQGIYIVRGLNFFIKIISNFFKKKKRIRKENILYLNIVNFRNFFKNLKKKVYEEM